MLELRPVQQPQRRRDGLLALLMAALLIGVLLAVAKPWETVGSPVPPLALSSLQPTASATASPLPPGTYRNYSTGLFGDHPHAPAFELWAAGYYIDFGFSRVLFYEPTPVPASGLDAAGALDLGTTATMTALGINHPEDVFVQGIRLWRFPAEGDPRRESIASLASPFDATTFAVIGIPRAPGSDVLANWPAGLYRLDLLIASGAAGAEQTVFSLTLRVEPDPTAPTPSPSAPPPAPSEPAPDLGAVRSLARPNELLAFGPGGAVAYQVAPTDGREHACDLARTWAAEAQASGPCTTVPAGQVLGLAVATGAGPAIRSVELVRLDPLPGTVGTVDLALEPGLAIVRTADDRLLPEGTYRLDVTTGDGARRTWYLQVGPGGAAVPTSDPGA
ncbi:MAG: hypothetical protein ACXVAI_02025 [Candidatus Limnocylindrales bacterium]